MEKIIKHYRPEKRCRYILSGALILLAAVIIALIIIFVPIKIVVNISVIAVSAIVFTIVMVYLPLFFRSVKYTATETEIVKTSGVFIKFHQSVRFSSVQYITTVRTPFSSKTGFNFIIFFVYGGQLNLLFLSEHDLEEIRILAENGGAQ